MKTNNLETFLQTIRSGKVARGCCITLDDSSVTEIAADAGMDFCWIDGEHGVIDRETMLHHIMALRGTGCASLVRVPDSSHTEIKKVIDMAPAGIIIPMVTTLDEAKRAVAACRYPPEGNRGCGFRRGNRYGADDLTEYLALSAHDPLVILQIEHIDAVRILDDILKTPGLDSLLIGPFDLSASIGKTGKMDDPELNGIIDEICVKTHRSGKLLGAYASADFGKWQRRGVQYLSMTNDVYALYASLHGMTVTDFQTA